MPKSLKLFLVLAVVIFAASAYIAMVGTIGLALRNYAPGGALHEHIDWVVVSGAIFDALTLVVTLLLAGLAVRPRMQAARIMFVALTLYAVLPDLPGDIFLITTAHFDFSKMAMVMAIIGDSEIFRFAPYVAVILPLLQLGVLALLFTGASRRWFEAAHPEVFPATSTMPLVVKLVAVACLFIALGRTWNYFGHVAILDQQYIARGYHPRASGVMSHFVGFVLSIEKSLIILTLGALVAFWRRRWVGWAVVAILGNLALYGLFTEAFVLPALNQNIHNLPGLPLYASLSPYVALATSVLCGIAVILLLLPTSRAWFATTKANSE